MPKTVYTCAFARVSFFSFNRINDSKAILLLGLRTNSIACLDKFKVGVSSKQLVLVHVEDDY